MVTAISDELKQKDEAKEESSLTGKGAAGSVVTAPATMGVGQAAKPQKAKTGTGFVNLERYLTGNPNAGKNMAEGISTKVKGAGEAYKTAGQNVIGEAQTALDKDVTKVAPGVIQGLKSGQAQTINTADTTFEGGPDVTKLGGYKPMQEAGTKFRGMSSINPGSSQAVKDILLEGSPKAYSSKMGALDEAFLSPQAQVFKGLKDYIGGVGNVEQATTESIGQKVAAKETEAAATQKAIKKAAGEGVEALDTRFQGLATTKSGEARKAALDAVKAKYKYDTGFDMTDAAAARYVSGQAGNIGEAMSPEELVNYNALAKLAGRPEIAPTTTQFTPNMEGVSALTAPVIAERMRAAADYSRGQALIGADAIAALTPFMQFPGLVATGVDMFGPTAQLNPGFAMMQDENGQSYVLNEETGEVFYPPSSSASDQSINNKLSTAFKDPLGATQTNFKNVRSALGI